MHCIAAAWLLRRCMQCARSATASFFYVAVLQALSVLALLHARSRKTQVHESILYVAPVQCMRKGADSERGTPGASARPWLRRSSSAVGPPAKRCSLRMGPTPNACAWPCRR